MGGLLGREFESPHLQRGIMAPKMDIRVQKTKERLKSTLLALLQEKSIDRISISEMCRKSGINRNTFYQHYRDIRDLLSEVEGEFMESLFSVFTINGDSIKSVRDLMLVLLETIKQNQDMCLLLFSDNGDKNFLRNILMFALPSAVENWVNELGMDKDDATVLYYYIMGGAVNVIELWMKEKLSSSLDDVADKLNALIIKSQDAFVSSC